MKSLRYGLIVVTCLVLIAGSAPGLTPTDPNTIDGIIENDPPIWGGTSWETDELMDSDGGTEFYLTWGDTSLFCALSGPLADLEDGDYDWFIAIDVDPLTGSGALLDGYSHVTFPVGFQPEFIYCFTGGIGWYESCEWDSFEEAWTWRGWQDDCSYGGWDDTLVAEICIPYSMLWYPVNAAIVSWISDENQTEVVASFPSANTVGPTSFESPRAMDHVWVAWDLGHYIEPNALPVEPPPPAATVDNERSYPFTCTAMADISPGNCGSTTQMMFYYTTDGSDPDSASTFVFGTYDSCRVAGDTTDTFYAIIPAPDEAQVTWTARGVAKNGAVAWSVDTYTFIQGGTAWLGNEGSSSTTCTVWAEIYVGDGGQFTWIAFPYTSDGTDPRTSETTQMVDGMFDYMVGNNDRFYAIIEDPAPGDTILWYAFGEDTNQNYAESGSTFMFIQGDTADIHNLVCNPDSNSLTGEVAPGGWGTGMDFYWTTDGTDPKTSETVHVAYGSHVEETDTTSKFTAVVTAETGQLIRWYVHAWASDNSFGDSPVQECFADTTTGPMLCRLTCVPESLIVRASIYPAGYGAEIEFRATHDGSDPKTSPNVGVIAGSWLRDDASPGGDCVDTLAVGVFYAQFPAEEGDTIKWYAHGWYQPHHPANGLFGDSPVQTCVSDTSVAGVDTGSMKSPPTSLGSVPNPFGNSTQITFELARPSEVTVAIYDTRGKLVATVFDGMLPEGENLVTWDGRDGHGEEVSPGIYFCRLKADDFVVTRKTILVR